LIFSRVKIFFFPLSPSDWFFGPLSLLFNGRRVLLVGKPAGVRGKQLTAACAFLMDTGTTFFIFTVLPNKVAEALTNFFSFYLGNWLLLRQE
jgi:hypothetical protein